MVKKNNNEYFEKSTLVKKPDGGCYQNVEYVKKKLKWRVVYGYMLTDYVSIEEHELEKAKYAWITKSIFSTGDRMISGSEIKRIEPDWRYYTGWSEGYEPKSGDDFAQIKRDMPTHLIEDRNRMADARVKYIIENDKPELLNQVEAVDNLLPEADKPILSTSPQVKALEEGRKNLLKKFTL
jgi:hypothetical protein